MKFCRLAPLKWAQNGDKVYLTVDLRDISDEKITWKAPDHLIFSGISDGKKYGFKLRFFAELDTKVTQSHIAG